MKKEQPSPRAYNNELALRTRQELADLLKAGKVMTGADLRQFWVEHGLSGGTTVLEIADPKKFRNLVDFNLIKERHSGRVILYREGASDRAIAEAKKRNAREKRGRQKVTS